MFEKQTPQEAAGHNSGPPKQTYYCGSGLLMDYPLGKLVGCCFLIGCKKASYIFGKLGICESFKWKKLRKQFIKRKKALAKEKDRRNVWKISPQEAAGHNSGPPKQTYYCGSECDFKGKEISRDQVKETKKVKEKR